MMSWLLMIIIVLMVHAVHSKDLLFKIGVRAVARAKKMNSIVAILHEALCKALIAVILYSMQLSVYLMYR